MMINTCPNCKSSNDVSIVTTFGRHCRGDFYALYRVMVQCETCGYFATVQHKDEAEAEARAVKLFNERPFVDTELEDDDDI